MLSFLQMLQENLFNLMKFFSDGYSTNLNAYPESLKNMGSKTVHNDEQEE